MNSYTIYTPISSTMLVFACFERFCTIQVYKPKSQDEKMFLRPIGSKKIVKVVQNDPTRHSIANTTAKDE